MRELTAKEEAFARAVALDGMTLSDAYRATRDCSKMAGTSINSNAKKIARRSHVKRRIEQIKEQGSGLTPKQDAFCFYYLETSNASEAYRRAYDVATGTKPETVHREAKALLDNPKVTTRLIELRAGLRRRHEVTADTLVEELEEARTMALKIETPMVAVTATLGKAKLLGLVVDKAEFSGPGGGPIPTQEMNPRAPSADALEGILKRYGAGKAAAETAAATDEVK